eukprot:scaffold138934_cov47-Prasinocladus_malaysianus.AAC.3
MEQLKAFKGVLAAWAQLYAPRGRTVNAKDRPQCNLTADEPSSDAHLEVQAGGSRDIVRAAYWRAAAFSTRALSLPRDPKVGVTLRRPLVLNNPITY